MEQRNEPTTAEIVKALRERAKPRLMRLSEYEKQCCVQLTGAHYKTDELSGNAAARLEQLERENAELRQVIADGADFTLDASKGYRFAGVEMGEAMRMVKEYPALKSRAEKAEADVEDAYQRGYEEGMDEARHQYEEDGFV